MLLLAVTASTCSTLVLSSFHSSTLNGKSSRGAAERSGLSSGGVSSVSPLPRAIANGWKGTMDNAGSFVRTLFMFPNARFVVLCSDAYFISLRSPGKSKCN